jgi:hypothetical protein
LVKVVEAIENTAKHGKVINGIKEGILTISKTATNYVLETGNYIGFEAYQKLNTTLTNIKKLSLQELNSHYKKVIMETEITEEGNTELGFIEIARKSNNFSFEFEPSSNNDYFYKIKISV